MCTVKVGEEPYLSVLASNVLTAIHSLNSLFILCLQALRCCMESCVRICPVLQDSLIQTVKRTMKFKQHGPS